ncbi:MAG: alanine:cation symporter family protein [Clostridia bacterium]|nr:alanine:cation symporter family protein [Clostridia bacterium]
MKIISFIYNIFWGDLFKIPLPGGAELGISLLVLILIPAGIFFTVRTKFLPIRLFPEMLRISAQKQVKKESGALSGMQALIVSTATRVGMGNMVGVVAALSAGGAGAVFWMWVTALIGSSTAFVEATLAQIYKEPDPLYGGYRGGPALYINAFVSKGKQKKRTVLGILFAFSGLLCWCGVSQVISNSVTSSFKFAFNIPPVWTTVVLVALAAIIVLRKNTTVKVLDIMVPVMAVFYFIITIVVMVMNITEIPAVLRRIIDEAFGLRQVVAGGFGAALMNGVKRGLFSNEAGSGSAPCAAAAADVSHPAKAGLFQAFGVIIDTIVICTCTDMIMLLTPEGVIGESQGMELLQTSMQHHFGYAGVVFTAITLGLFCFSTFIGILYYARSNVSYIFGDNWKSQTGYKIVALIMLFVGGLAAYTFVWDIGDIGIALMTVFNMIALIPMSGKAIRSLNEYTAMRKAEKLKSKDQ